MDEIRAALLRRAALNPSRNLLMLRSMLIAAALALASTLTAAERLIVLDPSTDGTVVAVRVLGEAPSKSHCPQGNPSCGCEDCRCDNCFRWCAPIPSGATVQHEVPMPPLEKRVELLEKQVKALRDANYLRNNPAPAPVQSWPAAQPRTFQQVPAPAPAPVVRQSPTVMGTITTRSFAPAGGCYRNAAGQRICPKGAH